MLARLIVPSVTYVEGGGLIQANWKVGATIFFTSSPSVIHWTSLCFFVFFFYINITW